jgi:hypothetical protein
MTVRTRIRRRLAIALALLSVPAVLAIAAPGASATLPAKRAPVQQLPPGLVTLAHVATPQGQTALVLYRIRYFGKVALCVRQVLGAANVQSCANYPLGSVPVWWSAPYVGVCTRRHFQVISGVIVRRGLTAWLRTPSGTSRMAAATIPPAFGVSGPLVYALIDTAPASVTLRNASGASVYSAPVAPLPRVSTPSRCTGTTTITVPGRGQHVIP